MNNGRPSELGILEIADDAGNVIDKLNRLRLGPGLTLSRNDNDPSYVIDVISNIISSVVVLDSVTALRAMIVPPGVDKLYGTKNYYPSSTSGGGGFYRWDSSSTETDDGVLIFKLAFRTVGRMKYVNLGNDRMFDALRCGPALADLGTRTVSFDPTGVTPVREEFRRVTGILRSHGYEGILLPNNPDGSLAKYYFYGDEQLCPSTTPWIGFTIKTAAGASIYCTDARSANGAAFLQVYAEGEGGFVLFSGGYGPRYWTDGSGGLAVITGKRIANGVADITGLSVGDIMYVRLGSNDTDFSGMYHSYVFAEIKAITPTTGTAGNIEFWQGFPEDCPDSPSNPGRLYNKHDMVKVVGFQDNVVIDARIKNVCLSPSNYRKLHLNCTWDEVRNFAVDGLCGIGLTGSITVLKAHVPGAFNIGSIMTMAFQYNTHLSDLNVSLTNVDTVGVGQNTVQLNVYTEEANCRGTRIDRCTVESYDSQSGYNASTQIFYRTPGQTSPISVGTCIIKGGHGGMNVGGNIDVLDIRDGGSTSGQFVGFSSAYVKTLIYKGRQYNLSMGGEYDFPILTTAANTDFALPFHGFTRLLRIKVDSLTGVSDIQLVASGVAFSVISLVTVGQWRSQNVVEFTSLGYPQFSGYNSIIIRVITAGGTPAGNGVHVIHECFMEDMSNDTLTGVETSIQGMKFSNGAPSANADFFGQECFDTANSVKYCAVKTGTGATDWILSGSNKLLDGMPANGSIDFTGVAAPSTPASSHGRIYVDSTSKNLCVKKDDGFVSHCVNTKAFVASKFVSAIDDNGAVTSTQPSSADLSDLTTVALTDANATIAVGGGSYYALALSTLTSLRTLTLGNTGATDKQAIQVRVYSQGSNYLINDSAATLLLSVASGTKVVATFVWNTGTGKFQLNSWNFFT